MNVFFWTDNIVLLLLLKSTAHGINGHKIAFL